MFATQPYRRISDDRRKPLARYGAMESALRERLAPEVLHHQLGHDRPTNKAAAGAAYNSKGRWFRSNHAGMTQAYPPAWFTARMTSLKTRWDELNQAKASEQLAFAF